MSMIDVFLKSVGFDPAEFAQACVYYKAEFEGMKAGVVQAVQHFDSETKAIRTEQAAMEQRVIKLDNTLARMEIQISRVEALLLDLATRELKPNGHDRTEYIRDLNADPHG